MLKIENVEVVGFEAALRGMRNPMNSWEKSDSYISVDYSSVEPFEDRYIHVDIGPNDYELAMKLAKAGPVHAKYRRMITVYADITAPLYWWKEFDTYRNGVEKNSCSTMHRIAEREFTMDDFSIEHLRNYGAYGYDDNYGRFTEDDAAACYAKTMGIVVDALNGARNRYLDMKSRGEDYAELTKELWWQIIQLLPSSYNQRRTVMMSYEALANMYKYRKDHKQDEWRATFCDWIRSLPYSGLITLEENAQ